MLWPNWEFLQNFQLEKKCIPWLGWFVSKYLTLFLNTCVTLLYKLLMSVFGRCFCFAFMAFQSFPISVGQKLGPWLCNTKVYNVVALGYCLCLSSSMKEGLEWKFHFDLFLPSSRPPLKYQFKIPPCYTTGRDWIVIMTTWLTCFSWVPTHNSKLPINSYLQSA